MRLYLIRHAHSEANRLHQISNRGYQHGLTPLGGQQAAALVQRLAGQPLAAVYTSPLQRAVETAQPLAAATGAPLAVEPALREFDCGIYEGRGDPDAWAAFGRVWEAWVTRRDYEAPCLEGGESYPDLLARLGACLRAVVRAHPLQSTMALITHGGLLRVALPALVPGLPPAWRDWPMPNTAHTLIEADPAKGTLRCLEWRDA
jgi:probable phosphoglycerate mutase